MLRTRRIGRILAFSVAAVVILLFGLFVWGNMMLIGRPFPISQLDSLKDPVAVTGWDADGLVLANGQRLRLPLSKDLPVPAGALAAATKHGIEIDDSGTAFGLVQIHHWCGNDPVRYQLAKVNLASLLAYVAGLERAQLSNSARFTEGMDWPHAEAFIFGTHGWRIEWFHDFVSWEQSGISWLWQSEPRDDTASSDIESRARGILHSHPIDDAPTQTFLLFSAIFAVPNKPSLQPTRAAQANRRREPPGSGPRG